MNGELYRKLVIYNTEIRKNRLICLEVNKKQYWIETDSNYRAAKRKIKNSVEYYTMKCNRYDIDKYHYENGCWQSTMYNNFSGEVPTLNNCRNAMIYLEISHYFTILNTLLEQLDRDIIWLIKKKLCLTLHLPNFIGIILKPKVII